MTEQAIVKSRKKSKIKVGDEFTRLTVIENMGIIKGKTHFKCECNCGVIKIINGIYLKNGGTKSCGCLQKDWLLRRNIKHGMCGTAIYRTWRGMVNRCNNPNAANYSYYGGRGITVCIEWENSFIAFSNDMGLKPKGFTIERRDNDGDYCPENCYWATCINQAKNKRVAKNNETGTTGVYWNKPSKKYQVYITANHKRYHIGLFKILEQAKAARIAAEQKYWE